MTCAKALAFITGSTMKPYPVLLLGAYVGDRKLRFDDVHPTVRAALVVVDAVTSRAMCSALVEEVCLEDKDDDPLAEDDDCLVDVMVWLLELDAILLEDDICLVDAVFELVLAAEVVFELVLAADVVFELVLAALVVFELVLAADVAFELVFVAEVFFELVLAVDVVFELVFVAEIFFELVLAVVEVFLLVGACFALVLALVLIVVPGFLVDECVWIMVAACSLSSTETIDEAIEAVSTYVRVLLTSLGCGRPVSLNC